VGEREMGAVSFGGLVVVAVVVRRRGVVPFC
jgi:hypothetical protein